MKLNIKDIYQHDSDRGTTQTLHYIYGDIDGDPIQFTYIDGGNNAEYEEDLMINDINQQKKYLMILFNLSDEEGWSVFEDLKVGDIIELDKTGLKLEEERKKKAKLIAESAKTKRDIILKPRMKF